MRPKVKFLTVVWGETYIARFASLALPSFLAPGNLPALAEATDLEVVIMTHSDDIEYFQNHATFRNLCAICPVRFVEIDDLISTSVYGVTLTLAFARPIIACGREMLNTHFVFMNADFVLADGSLRSLCKHILAGRSIVLGPSFRSTAEMLEPVLESSVNTGTGVLTIPPRQLATIALAHPHPTTVAKTLNQDFCHSTQPNQFFWQVDKQTMLGRYYLIFMLCLKPERIIKTINCYCDYSFIPEMCPSGDEAVMDDSDDFFMLELQHRDQEMALLQLGRAPDEVIAESLQFWTTAEHRRAASHDIVFHTGDIPPQIEAAKAEASAFVNRIAEKLHRPLSHIRHKYWVHGIEAWRYHRKRHGLTSSPPELALDRSGFRDWFSLDYIRSSLQKCFLFFFYESRRLILEKLLLTPLHPYWLDYRLLRSAITGILTTPGACMLMVRDKPELVDRLIGPEAQVRFATVRGLLESGPPSPKLGSSGYTHVLVYLQREDCRQVQELVKRCQIMMGPAGNYQFFIHHRLGEAEDSNFSYELVRYVEDILGTPPLGATCTFVGGTLKRFYVRWLIRLLRQYSRFGKFALLWILPPLVVIQTITLIGNLYMSLKLPSRNYVKFCSSMVIQFKPDEHALRSQGRS